MGVPTSAGPIDPFGAAPLTPSGLPFRNIADFGSVGDGVANDTQPFIDAHAALPSTGGMIFAPPGTFLVDPTLFTISKPYVYLCGSGNSSILKRRTDTAGAIVMVTGTGFSAGYFRMQDVSVTSTNTAVGLYIANINDVVLHNLWLQTGYNLLFLDHGSNYSIYGCKIESARSNGIVANQASDVSVENNQFYFIGVGGAGIAGIQIAKDAGYTYRPYGWRIVGNAFEQGRSGHGILAVQASGAVITDNEFSFSGMLAPNTFDDINLQSCQWTAIDGNSFPAEFDANLVKAYGEVGYVRASRYNINIDGACQNTVIGANTYNPGTSGTINDLAPDTIGSQTAQSFLFEITNTGGTLQHRIIADANGTASTRATRISGASAALANTPSVAAGVPFVSGAGINAAATHQVIFNTITPQVDGRQIFGQAGLDQNTTGANFTYVDWRLVSSNVNGVTQSRLALHFKDAAGAVKALTVGNIPAATILRVRFNGSLY